MNEKQVIFVLDALAQETRLRIVRFLVSRGPNGARAGEIAAALDAASSRMSFHLSTLEQAGVVTAERVSRSIIYRIDYQHLGGAIGFLLNDCCARDPQIRACCMDGRC